MATSFDPVFTTTGEYGIVILSFSIYAAGERHVHVVLS